MLNLKNITAIIGVGCTLAVASTLGRAQAGDQSPNTAADGSVFYVATDGDDDWSGKLAEPNAEANDGPFATLLRARKAVRELVEAGLQTPVTVMIRGGTYYLSKPLTITPKGSGTAEHRVTYTSYPGETPILSGGERITGWKPYEGKILQADVPGTKGGKWTFRQLFLNGKRQIRARYPNFEPENPLYGGWMNPQTAEEDHSLSFNYEPNDFPRYWSKPQQGEVFMVQTMGLTDIIPIESRDYDNRLITLVDRPKHHGAMPYVTYSAPSFHITIGPEWHLYVANLLEELDQAGEWCLDTEDGVVYFWPPEGKLPSDAQVVAPRLATLIDLAGASYVTVSGLTLTETTCGDVMHRGGHEGYGAMLPIYGRKYAGEAIRMRGCDRCLVENNHIHAVGGNGIYMEGGNLRNIIKHNEIDEAGGIGVCVIGSKYYNPQNPRRYPLYNQVIDNHIHHCGVYNKYVAGVFLGLSQGTVIGHNKIDHMPHHAINLGNSGFGRNIIEYNEIRHVGLESCDKGAINMWMEDPYGHVERQAQRSGHVIRHNLVADFESQRLQQGNLKRCNPAFGIYLDNYSSNCYVYGNIVVRSGSVGIYIQGGKNNILENNIIVDCLSATHMGGWWQPQMEGFMTGNQFARNIFYRRDGDPGVVHRHIGFTTEAVDDAVGISDFNVYYHGEGKDFILKEASSPLSSMEVEKRTYPLWPEYQDIPYSEWVKRGHDANSVIADPMFVDLENDDFRLHPDSPALKLGFVQIDASKIGIRERKKSTSSVGAKPNQSLSSKKLPPKK